jgi:hypothetical protein
MILINLCGGPGCGKTTLSFYLAYRLKKAGVRAELVGEAARDHIYSWPPDRAPFPLLDNQLLLVGQGYERILRLQRHNFEVAVNDSPLVQCLLYCKGHVYYANLEKTIRDVEPNFDTYNVFIHPRPGCYDPESRTQRTEADARALDQTARDLMHNKFWMEVQWDEEEKLGDAVVALALSKRKKKRIVLPEGLVRGRDLELKAKRKKPLRRR